MAKLEIIIDASVLMKYYKMGLEDGFIIASGEFKELDEQLNINKIDPDGQEDNDTGNI